MLNYNNFILESYVENSINEGRLIFSNNFTNLLTSIDSDISEYLIRNANSECDDINANYIDLGTKSDTASFIQDNKISVKDIIFKLTNLYRFCREGFAVVDKSGFSTNGLVGSLNRNNNAFRLLDSAVVGDCTLYHLQFIDNPEEYVIVYKLLDDDSIMTPINDIRGNTDIKIGRLVGKILNSLKIKIKPNDLEDFVNKYKAAFELINNVESNFKVVKGEDIRKYYLNDNYFKADRVLGSQLWKSCMSYDYCQEYFDIYVDNPDVINMLVLLKDDKVLARALLWDVDGGINYMDRIYSISDSYKLTFESWGRKNGYTLYTDKSKGIMSVDLKPVEYDTYPYMDTFRYYNPKTGVATDDSDYFDDDDYIIISETDGGYT